MTEQQDQALNDAKAALEQSNRVPNQAIELANSALKFALNGDWETHAYAYAALGSSYASLGRYDEATRHVNEAQKIAFELRLTYVLARIHQARGWVAYSQDNAVTAFSDWQIAFDYFQQIRDMRGTAWILMHYAENYRTLGLLDHSIRCQISALDIVGLLQDSEAIADLKVSLARSYIAKAWEGTFVGQKGFSIFDSQIATAILLDILKQRLEDFTPILVEQAFQALGEALLIQGRPEEALPNLELAKTASIRNGHYSSEARVHGATGFAYHLCGDHIQGQRLILEAIQNAPEATPTIDLALLHMWHSQVLESLADYNGSLASLRKSVELDKSGQMSRMERWSRVHDMTLGIGPALVSVEWIAEKENGWLFTIEDLERHQKQVHSLLKGDSLTGVLNRTEALDLARERAVPFASIFEIQNLDNINWKFGRSVGDEVLRNFASVLVANLPADAIVGRFSGDEFYVAMIGDSFDSVMKALIKFPWIAIDPELNVRGTYRRVNPSRPHLLAA